MPRLLRPVALGELAVGQALDLVRAALDGSGDALLPLPPDAPGRTALAVLRPGTALSPGEDDEADPTALVLATSGSTGPPKGALLPASALLASARATLDRLGGPGTWLLALAPHHVAGVQVLVRSIVAGIEPGVLDLSNGFSPNGFVAASTALQAADRRYTALVPTQLVRLLDAGPDAVAALASYDGVLVGAAATPAPLLARAHAAGVCVVTTYGMSETCGGCVYDGLALDGVRVDLDDTGRVLLGGAVVARGYRSRPHSPELTERDGCRWFRTDDLGFTDSDGRLQVTGRADDVIVTGGLKVSPYAVEAVIAALPGVREVVVVGVPDDEWGQLVVAVMVADKTVVLQQVRDAVSQSLGSAAAPRKLVLVDQLPLRGPGKPDRRRAADLAR